jgi:hypothetical protein
MAYTPYVRKAHTPALGPNLVRKEALVLSEAEAPAADPAAALAEAPPLDEQG